MNYSTLFPELLKKVPRIEKEDICYHYQSTDNDNNNHTKIYIPHGKKNILWFLNYNGKYYSVFLEYDEKTGNINKCHFQYLSFKPELTNGIGTLICCTKINQQVCLEKILYWMGEPYTKPKCFSHMNDLKYMLQNYIHNMKYGSFVTLGLPIMGRGSNIVFEATSLPYEVYSIMSSNNQQIYIREFIATFYIEPIEATKDIYSLICKNRDNTEKIYKNAYVNDLKTSTMLKHIFIHNYKNYKNIEFSDDEEEDVFDHSAKNVIMNCVYLPKQNAWKPYKKTLRNVDFFSKIKFIENKKYESYI